MALKYKIHDLAKNFGISSKELLELIKDKTVSGKKYSTMTVITDEDLEIFFELITRSAEVPSFAELEASAKPIQITAKSIEDIESTVRGDAASGAGKESKPAEAEKKPAVESEAAKTDVKAKHGDKPGDKPGEKPVDKKPGDKTEKIKDADRKPKEADKAKKAAADKQKPAEKEREKVSAASPDKEREKDKTKEKTARADNAPAQVKPQKPADALKQADKQADKQPAAKQGQSPAKQPSAEVSAPAAKEPEPARKAQVQGGAKILSMVDLSAIQKPQKQKPQQQQGRKGGGQQGGGQQQGGKQASQKQQQPQKSAADRIESSYKPAVPQAKSAEDIEASRKAKEMRKLKEQSRQNKRSEKREDGDIIRLQGSAKETGGDTVVVQQEAALGKADSGVKKRIVDTRSSNVDIERYNQKYDDLAHAKGGRASEQGAGKQKLTQKSQQYKKGGKAQRKRETEAERLKRIALERKLKPIEITIPDEITVSELASRLKMTGSEVIKKLISLGEMKTLNDTIDFDTAYLAATELGAKAEREVVVSIEERIIDDSEDTDEKLVPRSPVVVVMGHVDHGKTSLLDYIRHTHVTAGEAGGITQHIGAYRVNIGDREITFLDTPGHEAFTTMRARGAQVTDIAVLVIAADDGIMPQTVEAINHAKMAGVSIIVAMNKMDKQGANPAAIMQQLTEYELLPEQWGGDVICCPVSAKTGEGVDDLLENIVLVADMKELKANPDRPAKGTVIEARLDKGRGPVATVLVQNGTLHNHDVIVAGMAVGRVRAMTDEHGKEVESAGPSIPVEITGLDSVPQGGDVFNAVSDERLARELVEQRRQQDKEMTFQQQTRVTLDNVFDQMKEGDMKELKIIVKGDVQGSVEAVRQSLEKLSNEEVRVHIIHGAVGAVNESDVMLADASNAIIVGFNVRPDTGAAESAARAGVDLRLYRIIYDCIEEIESALKGMLAPKTRVVDLGRAEVRQTIKISNVGTIAGSYVVSGRIERRALIRVVRDGIVIAEDQIKSLRRFKDDVKEVQQGYECGIGLEKYNDIKEGDFLEAFIIEEYRE